MNESRSVALSGGTASGGSPATNAARAASNRHVVSATRAARSDAHWATLADAARCQRVEGDGMKRLAAMSKSSVAASAGKQARG